MAACGIPINSEFSAVSTCAIRPQSCVRLQSRGVYADPLGLHQSGASQERQNPLEHLTTRFPHRSAAVPARRSCDRALPRSAGFPRTVGVIVRLPSVTRYHVHHPALPKYPPGAAGNISRAPRRGDSWLRHRIGPIHFPATCQKSVARTVGSAVHKRHGWRGASKVRPGALFARVGATVPALLDRDVERIDHIDAFSSARLIRERYSDTLSPPLRNIGTHHNDYANPCGAYAAAGAR